MQALFAQQGGEPLIRFTLQPLTEEHGIPLAVMGIVVVFLALTLVVLLINLLPRALERLFGSETQSQSPPVAVAEVTAREELAEETLVVIAAAVAETIRKPHRIIRIRGLTPEDLGWSLEGRMQHHRSHMVHQRDRR